MIGVVDKRLTTAKINMLVRVAERLYMWSLHEDRASEEQCDAAYEMITLIRKYEHLFTYKLDAPRQYHRKRTLYPRR